MNRFNNREKKSKKARPLHRTEVVADETLDVVGNGDPSRQVAKRESTKRNKRKKALLQVDSSNLTLISSNPKAHDSPRQKGATDFQDLNSALTDDNDMKKALAEVERLRLEMQRAQDRVAIADYIPEEGTLIAKKKKKKKKKKDMKEGGRTIGENTEETRTVE